MRATRASQRQKPQPSTRKPIATATSHKVWSLIHGETTPAISAALFARFVSQRDDSTAMKAIAALRNQFGGHAVLPETEHARDQAQTTMES